MRRRVASNGSLGLASSRVQVAPSHNSTSALTLPSRGRLPAYGLQLPLMSNVRRLTGEKTQCRLERFLERRKQAGGAEITRFGKRRSSVASSALHLGRRRRTSRPSAVGGSLGSNNKSSARAEAPASTNASQGYGAGACICGRCALPRQRRQVRWHHHRHAYHTGPTDA